MTPFPCTLLVVDASPEDRELYRRYLLQDVASTYTILEASSAQAGLDLWHQHQPAVVFLEYQLPDFNGLDFLAQLPSTSPFPCLPAVVVTGYGNEAVAVEVMKAGAQDYLVKGQLTPERLQQAVKRTIKAVELSTQLQRERDLYQQSQAQLAECQRNEANLHQCEAWLQLALKASGTGLWDCNLQSGHIQWSENLEAMFGLAPGQFDGSFEMFASLVHPDDRDHVLATIEQAIATGEDYKIEFRVVYPDGRIRWALSQGKVFYDLEGNPVRITGSDSDITVHKQVQQALWEAEERLRVALQNAPITVFSQDRQLKYTWIYNPVLHDFQNLLGKHDREYLPAAEAEALTTLKEQVLSSGMGTRQEVTVSKDGIEYFYDLTLEPFFDASNTVVGLTGAAIDISDFKRTEQTLRESEERLRISHELSLYAFTTLDSVRDENGKIIDFVWTYVNPKAAEILKRPIEELLGQRLLQVLPGNKLNSELFDRYVQVVETGEPLEIELPYKADGITGWFRNMTVKLRDGVSIVFSDITDRKQAEENLIKTKNILQAVVNGTDDVIFVKDLEGRYVLANQGAAQWFNLTAEHMLGKNDAALFPADIAQRFQAAAREVIQSGTSIIYDESLLKDGERRSLLARKYPWRNENGEIVGVIGFSSDITERKIAEQTLRENEQRFITLAQASPVVIFQLNRACECIYVNSRWRELTGQPEAIALGTGWIETLRLDEHDHWIQSWHQWSQNPQQQGLYQNEGRVLRSDGSTLWYYIQALPLMEGDTITGYIGTLTDITERKKTEEALRENEQLLRLALSGAQAGSWNWHFPTGNVNWSPENYALYGLDPATTSPSYEVWTNAIHPDDRESTHAEVLRVVEQKLPSFRTEFRILHSQKGVRWLLGLGQLTLNEQGEPIYMSGINLDITERKQSEEMLRRTAERDAFRVALTDALRSLDDPIEIQATASRILGQYLGASRVLYFEVHETYYFIAHDYVNGAQPLRGEFPIEAFGSSLITAYRDGLAVCVTDVATDPSLSPDQRSAYAALQIAAHIGIPLVKHGQLVAGLAIHSTTPRAWIPEEVCLAEEVAERTWAAVERARIEADLRVSHDTFRHLVENSPFGVYVVDADFRLAQVSTGAQKVFARVHPLLGRDFAEVLRILWPEPFASETMAHFKHTLATGKTYHAPNTVERRQDTNEVESYDWKIERITLPDGRFGVVCHFYDLSERQQLLQREQAARAEAERVNRIKDEFLAILSHELRSPLNPILGWTKLLQSRKFDPAKTSEALATIERNVKLQTQLIDDLLDIAKILRGKLSVKTEPVDLVFVIEAAIESVSAAAVAKEIHLCSVLPQIGQVSGDAARLQQIMWNILSNAIKFTPTKGQVEIYLSREGNQAQITVKDTGKGINPDFLPHIFESFRQEDASTTRKYGGLGLGLAIVRHLVEAHGGTICASSPGEGQGSIFIVQFPLLDAQSDQPSSEVIGKDDLALKGMRILAVDDEPDALALLTALLTQYGAEVLTVASATEVLTHLPSFRPDVLISDIGMPEVDGYALLQKIRALPPTQGGQIPAIAVTAYASEGDYQKAINSGYQRHITKPLDPEVLVRALLPFIR